jgi:outer membrane lipoprotein LolB
MRWPCGTAVQWRWLWGANGAVIALAAAMSACTPTALERDGAGTLPAPEPTFEIAGRLSARHGADAFAGNFQWRHAGARDELALVSPTGQTVALLSGDERGVQLRASDGRIETASDWAALTERGLGWQLPVGGLAFWIQGAPRSGAPFAVEAGEGGRAAVLRQDGWTIVYQAYAPDAGAILRPARLTLSYPEVELRLAVDSWR